MAREERVGHHRHVEAEAGIQLELVEEAEKNGVHPSLIHGPVRAASRLAEGARRAEREYGEAGGSTMRAMIMEQVLLQPNSVDLAIR